MDIEASIREFIAKNLLFAETFTHSDDTSFLQEGIVDSLGVMELVAFVQKQFGITVEAVEVTPDRFDTVAQLAAFVRQKLGRGSK
jgi:acyl carrier protein